MTANPVSPGTLVHEATRPQEGTPLSPNLLQGAGSVCQASHEGAQLVLGFVPPFLAWEEMGE